VEGEVDEEESREVAVVPVVEVVPTYYRWISSSKPSPDAPPGDNMFISSPYPPRYYQCHASQRSTVMGV
jgi:hypothetical protein